MISATSSAMSALTAFSTKINSNANNIANIQSEGFKKTRVTNEETENLGVQAVVEKVDTPGMMSIEETSDGTEMVELSNVDMAEELTDSTLNARFYEANLKTIKTEDEMTQSMLDILA
jgi:flagellar basal body rod protein FlgG